MDLLRRFETGIIISARVRPCRRHRCRQDTMPKWRRERVEGRCSRRDTPMTTNVFIGSEVNLFRDPFVVLKLSRDRCASRRFSPSVVANGNAGIRRRKSKIIPDSISLSKPLLIFRCCLKPCDSMVLSRYVKNANVSKFSFKITRTSQYLLPLFVLISFKVPCKVRSSTCPLSSSNFAT